MSIKLCCTDRRPGRFSARAATASYVRVRCSTLRQPSKKWRTPSNFSGFARVFSAIATSKFSISIPVAPLLTGVSNSRISSSFGYCTFSNPAEGRISGGPSTADTIQSAVDARDPVDDRIATGAITKELVISPARTARSATTPIGPKLSRPLHLISEIDVHLRPSTLACGVALTDT